MADFLHLAYFQGFPHDHVSVFPTFLLLNNIPSYEDTRICSSIRRLMGIGVDSTFWLLRIMLLINNAYKFICRYTFSFLWGIYLEVEFPDHLVTLGLIF